MKASFMRSYTSKKGNKTFVYGVTGSDSQLADFKKAQGDFFREDKESKEALWFTTRFIGKVGGLIITTNGNVVADMSAYDQAASLAAQYGGNFGQELAKQAALGILGTAPSNTPSEQVAEPESTDLDAV